MGSHLCCRGSVTPRPKEVATEVTTPRVHLRKSVVRIGSTLKWITPTAVLVLIPKCPMCVAAYVALGTGVSIAMPVAMWIRYGLFIACFAVLGFLAIGTIRRWMPKSGFAG